MASKKPTYDAFFERLKEKEKSLEVDFQRKRLNKTMQLAAALVATLSIASILELGSGGLSFSRKDDGRFEEIQSEIVDLQTQIEALSKTLKDNESAEFTYLAAKLAELDQESEYLRQTILVSPESAITPKILREEQRHLSENFEELNDQVQTTNNILIGLFVTIIGGIAIKFLMSLFSKQKTGAVDMQDL